MNKGPQSDIKVANGNTQNDDILFLVELKVEKWLLTCTTGEIKTSNERSHV